MYTVMQYFCVWLSMYNFFSIFPNRLWGLDLHRRYRCTWERFIKMNKNLQNHKKKWIKQFLLRVYKFFKLYAIINGTLCGASRRVRKQWEWYGRHSHRAVGTSVRTERMGQWYIQILYRDQWNNVISFGFVFSPWGRFCFGIHTDTCIHISINYEL